MLKQLNSKEVKRVILMITGGCADVIQLPPGVELEVRDYDIQETDRDDVKRDKEGDYYQEMFFREPTE
jgi:hypothetical protein